MCPTCKQSKHSIRKGWFHRKTGQLRKVQRFFCKQCGKCFSSQTNSDTYWQKKPYLRSPIFRLLCAGVSQRETALVLGISKETVAAQLVKMARIARREFESRQSSKRLERVVFDEMETFEHTKCKPLSIALAVDEGSREILHVEVAQMPAKGPLAKIARKKYGRRRDYRKGALKRLLARIRRLGGPKVALKSDQSPRYPSLVKEHLPEATHETWLGRRGCVVGQGELKAGGFDPLFSLNHTAARIRDLVKCLSRRSWCTTKDPNRLQDRLDLFKHHYNQRLAGIKRPKLLRPAGAIF